MSLVYPADATPGHLLSVVPVQQLAMLHQRQKLQREAQERLALQKQKRSVSPKTPPPAAKTPTTQPAAPPVKVLKPVAKPAKRQPPVPPPPLPAIVPILRPDPRFTDAIRSQQQWLLQLQGR